MTDYAAGQMINPIIGGVVANVRQRGASLNACVRTRLSAFQMLQSRLSRKRNCGYFTSRR
jgi:hypothetical protein